MGCSSVHFLPSAHFIYSLIEPVFAPPYSYTICFSIRMLHSLMFESQALHVHMPHPSCTFMSLVSSPFPISKHVRASPACLLLPHFLVHPPLSLGVPPFPTQYAWPCSPGCLVTPISFFFVRTVHLLVPPMPVMCTFPCLVHPLVHCAPFHPRALVCSPLPIGTSPPKWDRVHL